MLIFFALNFIVFVAMICFAQEEGEEQESDDPGKPSRGFRKGSDEKDQLEGIEKKQRSTRRACRRKLNEDLDPEEDEAQANEDIDENYYIPIESVEKSKRRLKNRLDRIGDAGDAHREFDA
jgi:hypothetical protein